MKTSRTFSFRAALIAIASMVVVGIWIQFHEVLLGYNILAENTPPAGAVGVFLGIILIGGVLTWLRPQLRLTKGELIVIYAALMVCAPLMTQGMWRRFLGLTFSVPRNYMGLVDSYSEKLWPHGEHLIPDRCFAKGLGPDMEAAPADRVQVVDVPKSRVGAVRAVQIENADTAADADAETTFRIRVPRVRDGREILVPGEKYYLTALFRLTGFISRSYIEVEVVSDGGERVPVVRLNKDTKDLYSTPGGFQRQGQIYVNLPRSVKEYADVVFTLSGRGRVAVTDVNFFSNEAMSRAHKGTTEIQAAQLDKLPDNQRDSLLVRPDAPYSPAWIWYTLKGYIPWDQWAQPLFYWGSIVVAMFLGLLGIGIIFRKQWSENERFSYPLVALPRLLIEEEEKDGRLIRPLYRKPIFRVGLVVALVYCLMQGVAFYVPGMPNPTIEVNVGSYFADPAVKAFVQGMSGEGNQFKVILTIMAIAFFIDLDLLLSIIVFFWVCKIPYYFGELYGWKGIKGINDDFPFPHEQHIGAFLSLALVVLWISRKHLAGVGRTILGVPGGVDDAREAMPYRWALFLTLGAFVYFGLWGSWTGLGAWNALLFFGFLVLCGFSAARIRTECGAPWTYFTPYYPYLIFFLLGGLNIFPLQTMILTYAAGGFMAVAQFLLFAPTQVEMLHLADTEKASPRGVTGGLLLGILGAVLIGGYVMLVWNYGKGGDNLDVMKGWGMGQAWYFRSLDKAVLDMDSEMQMKATTKTAERASKIVGPWISVGVGSGATLLLAILRARFVGFWLHPLGYILANSFFIYMVWGSLHAAWLVKWLGLKVGGPRVIRDYMTPFFAGIFVGGVAGIFVWDVLALILKGYGVHDVFAAFP